MKTRSRRIGWVWVGLIGMGTLGGAIASGGSFEGASSQEEQRGRPLQRTQQLKRKSINELVAILKGHPGGQQAVALANKGGARVTPPSGGASLPLAAPAGAFSVILEPGHFRIGNNWASFQKVDIASDDSIRITGSNGPPSRALIRFAFPKNGWYILNVEGLILPNRSVTAKIRQTGPTVPGQAFQTWVYPKNNGAQPVEKMFPTVFEYKGFAYPVEFYVDSGEMQLKRITVEEL